MKNVIIFLITVVIVMFVAAPQNNKAIIDIIMASIGGIEVTLIACVVSHFRR